MKDICLNHEKTFNVMSELGYMEFVKEYLPVGYYINKDLEKSYFKEDEKTIEPKIYDGQYIIEGLDSSFKITIYFKKNGKISFLPQGRDVEYASSVISAIVKKVSQS